ncbi:MAG: hypothetical protein DSY42_04610, partial [Aquifex sp.]
IPTSNGYRRLIFGAVRSRNRTYDLGGWGRFAKVLGEVLEELGHKVLYPSISVDREEPEGEHISGDHQDEITEKLPSVDLSDLYDESGELPI